MHVMIDGNRQANVSRWKQMENKWKKALEEGKKVQVKIEPKYTGDSQRPDRIEVRFKIGEGRWQLDSFENKAGG